MTTAFPLPKLALSTESARPCLSWASQLNSSQATVFEGGSHSSSTGRARGLGHPSPRPLVELGVPILHSYALRTGPIYDPHSKPTTITAVGPRAGGRGPIGAVSVNGLHILDSVVCMSVMLMCMHTSTMSCMKCRIERVGFTVHYRYIRGRVTTCTTTFGGMREYTTLHPLGLGRGPLFSGPLPVLPQSQGEGAEPHTEGAWHQPDEHVISTGVRCSERTNNVPVLSTLRNNNRLNIAYVYLRPVVYGDSGRFATGLK